MIIELTPEQLERCYEFSYKCAENQQSIEFGQSDTKPRGINEITRDNLIGKVAEVAFANLLNERYGLVIPLDFNYYPIGVWDEQDAVINDWRIDIKCTRKGGQWLLIEWNKLAFRYRDGNLPHLFVMSSIEWDRQNDTPSGNVDLIGSASIFKFQDNNKDVLILHKGDLIPFTHTKLQADNYGIRYNNLEHDWDKVVDYMLTNKPPDLSNYNFVHI